MLSGKVEVLDSRVRMVTIKAGSAMRALRRWGPKLPPA
jgi:hypothetical protein